MTDSELENAWINREVDRDKAHQRVIGEFKHELELERDRAERLEIILGLLLFAFSFLLLFKIGSPLVSRSREWVRVLSEWGLIGYTAVGIPFMRWVARKIGRR